MAMAATTRKARPPAQLQLVKGLKPAPKAVRAQMDTIVVTRPIAESWKLPPFQRALKVNRKVLELAEMIKVTKVIPGILSLGRLDGETYLVDGQHRREAFYIADVPEAYSDVRIYEFDTLADMADEFAQQNSRLVNMTPDDYLRAMESSVAALMYIRQRCPYVGYGAVRQAEGKTVISMSVLVRSWSASGQQVPQARGSAMEIVEKMDEAEGKAIVHFLQTCYAAWGKDPSTNRLWSALNFALCAWLWRNTVTGNYTAKSSKFSEEQFKRCLMSLAASGEYCDWQLGRKLTERDRAPCYARIKSIFAGRLAEDMPQTKIYFPLPDWARGAR